MDKKQDVNPKSETDVNLNTKTESEHETEPITNNADDDSTSSNNEDVTVDPTEVPLDNVSTAQFILLLIRKYLRHNLYEFITACTQPASMCRRVIILHCCMYEPCI
jgi:hypothetical protein